MDWPTLIGVTGAGSLAAGGLVTAFVQSKTAVSRVEFEAQKLKHTDDMASLQLLHTAEVGTLNARITACETDRSSQSKELDTLRARHNELERRYNDKMEDWLAAMTRLVPKRRGDYPKGAQA